MRSSSVKSIVAALSIVVATAVCVPTTHAAPMFTRSEVVRDRGADKRDGAFDIVRRLIARFRSIGTNTTPSVPIPAPVSNVSPTTPIP